MLKWLAFFQLLVICNVLDAAVIQQKEITFVVDGTEHHELRKVDGNIVTLTDAMDGFLVVLDYGRDIFMVKNLTSQECFFSRLEYIPMAEDQEIPVMVRTVTNETGGVGTRGQNAYDIVFSPTEKIPTGYILLTNDVIVAEECSSGPSYWLKTETATRQRRDFWSEFDKVVRDTTNVVRVVIAVAEVASWFSG